MNQKGKYVVELPSGARSLLREHQSNQDASFFSLSLFHVPPPLMSVVPGSSLLSCLSQLTKKVRSNSTLQPSHHHQHIHSVQFYSWFERTVLTTIQYSQPYSSHNQAHNLDHNTLLELTQTYNFDFFFQFRSYSV